MPRIEVKHYCFITLWVNAFSMKVERVSFSDGGVQEPQRGYFATSLEGIEADTAEDAYDAALELFGEYCAKPAYRKLFMLLNKADTKEMWKRGHVKMPRESSKIPQAPTMLLRERKEKGPFHEPT